MTYTDAPPLLLHVEGHDPRAMSSARWYAAATDAEREVLREVPGPVLDVGCGPGRLVVALQQVGHIALGIDDSLAAIDLARSRGAPALCRSVFDQLPAERRWGSVLLFDGNIGIGGDPVMLLRRVADLISPVGQIVVEVDPPGRATATATARLQRGASQSREFPWAFVA